MPQIFISIIVPPLSRCPKWFSPSQTFQLRFCTLFSFLMCAMWLAQLILLDKRILTWNNSVKEYKDMKFQIVEHIKTKWVNFMDQRVLLMGWRYGKETKETKLRHLFLNFIALCTYGLTCDIIIYMFLMKSHIYLRGSLSI